MNGWEAMRSEGRSYLSIVSKSSGSKKFSATLLYNFAAMAIEKYVMATCMFNDLLPENHTLTDLLSALPDSIRVPSAVCSTLLAGEDVQQLCSLDAYKRTEPSAEELDEFITAALALCLILENSLPVPQTQTMATALNA